MSIFDPIYIDRQADTKLKSLVLNRLNKDKFDELSSHSADEIWFIQDSELSGQPIVVDTTPRPTKLSEFQNDVPYLSAVSWNDINNRPTIPTQTSQLTNNSGYVTSAYVQQQVLTAKTKWRDWHQQDYDPRLAFTAEEANSTVGMHRNYRAPTVSLEYSTDDGTTWSDFIVDSTTVTLANVGDRMLIRAKTTNDRISGTSSYDTNQFVMTGKIAASGSVMYLLKNDGDLDTIPSQPDCLGYIFWNCTSLTQAPELPATTLATECYRNMFQGCTSLTKSPELPATTLAERCYSRLFYGCTSLNQIKLSYTGNFTDSSTNSPFNEWTTNVPGSGTFYYNGTDTTRGVYAIPSGWTIQSF